MDKKKRTRVILLGALSIGLLALASWWSVRYNDARLVAPTNFSTYVFRLQDLPMLLALALFLLYVLGSGKLLGSLEYTFLALLIVLSLVLGLVLFLREYLLYRYDHDEGQE